MFCPKCGNQLPDEAAFCPKCGFKLSEIEFAEPTSSKTKKAKADSTASETPKKKKSKKLPLILGVVAVIIVVIILASIGGDGEIDYKATVRAYKPYAESQGISYTCGQVFDQYLSNAAWTVRESDGGANVDISGTAKGTDKKLAVTIQVDVTGDSARFTPGPVKLGGEELTENAFFALFVACDQQDEDLSHIGELIAEVDLALGGGELLGTFADPTTGVSFRYPEWWVALDTSSEYEIASLLSPRNTANHRAQFKVSKTFDFYDVFSGDAAAVQASVNEIGTFLDYGDAMLGDVPAKVLRYRMPGSNGDDTVVSFWYTDGQEVYQVVCSYSDSTSALYAPIFQVIMESYTAAGGGDAVASASGLCFRGVPVDALLGASYDDMIEIFGKPNSTMYGNEDNYYGDATIHFDMWSLESPYLCSITSRSLDDVTYNGRPLSDRYDELSQIMGREPDDARVYYDTYSMTYTWDYMGSDASLTVSTPAAEGSMATTEVSISWWYM